MSGSDSTRGGASSNLVTLSQAGAGPSRLSVPPMHRVHFYDQDASLLSAVGAFLADGLTSGGRVVIIATPEHRRPLLLALEARGIDTAEAALGEQLVVLDAHDVLREIMRGGLPDRALFHATLRPLLARPGNARLRAYGEMVDVLWKRQDRTAAILLEELWNGLQAEDAFELYCAYGMAGFYKEPADLDRVCATHTHVVMPPAVDRESESPLGSTGTLQGQRLVIEIARRKEVEAALRDALRQLRTGEEHLHDFVENAAVGLHRVGPDGTVLWVNRTELEMLGYTEAEVVGHPIADFYVDEELCRDVLARLARGERLQDVEVQLLAKDGSIKDALVSSSAFTVDGRFVHTRCVTRDITAQRALERDREQMSVRAQALLRITSALADAVTHEQVFHAVVDEVAEAIGATSAGLWLLEEDHRARLVRSIGYSDAVRARLEVLPIDAGVPITDAIRSGHVVWIPTQSALLDRYPHLGAVVTVDAAYRVACLPLSAQGRTLGGLGLTIPESKPASDDERDLVVLVARYASQAIERIRLLEVERRSLAESTAATQRLRVLSHASRALSESSLDRESRIKMVAAELSAVLGGCVNIATLEADGLLHMAAVHHPYPEAQAFLGPLASSAPLQLGEGVTGTIAATGRSMLLPRIDAPSLGTEAPSAYQAFLRRFPAYALIGAPLKSRGRVIGTVTAARVRSGETYTADDLALLEELAERAAVALENAWLYEQALSARSRAEQLYEFAHAVVNAERLDSVHDAALAAIQRAVGTSRAAILTSDAAGAMRFRAWRGLSNAYRDAVEGHSPWAADVVDPQPVLVGDVEKDPSWAPFLDLFRREGIGALAFVPLVSGGRLLGKLMMYFERPRTLSPSEVDLVVALGNHLASVIARYDAVASLQETVRQNELFTGVLAHDLRNPLGAVSMAAQVLALRRERAGEQKNDDPVNRILASCQRMSKLIDQLLDFTRVRSGGGIEVNPDEVDLAALTRQAVDELSTAQPTWSIEIREAGDLLGWWDADRILQVLSNLVANAGQHGTAGRPIEVALDGTEANDVRIVIRNAGAIPSVLQPHLFDPFRAHREGRERSSGLGLGLYIVQEIVRAHGGGLTIESADETGTTVRVVLPRRCDGVAPSTAQRPSREPTPGAGPQPVESTAASVPRADLRGSPRVLVVDDDLDVREALVDALEDQGWIVCRAANGVEALQVLRAEAALPDVILLDLMMPIMDGYGFVDAQRKDQRLASIPVVVVTASRGIDRARLGESISVVAKPIRLPHLMSALETVCENESR